MQAFLDGQELRPDRPTLAAVLAVAVRTAESAGRIIVEAWVDGRPLTNEELDRPSDVPGSALRLELVSAEPRELVATTLLDGVAALEELEAVQRAACKAIQSGAMAESLEDVRRVVETWTGVRAILERGSAILGVDLAGLSPEPFGPMVETLTRQLGAMKDALQRQDWSVVSDCVGYELTEQARAWRMALAGIAAALSGASGTVGSDRA